MLRNGLQAPYKKQLEPMLVQHVLPLHRSPYGHLRAKACWVSGIYADIEFAEGAGMGQHFNALFAACVQALHDPDLPVSASPLPKDNYIMFDAQACVCI